jgi:AcrB/AcrD/AcrF family
VFVTVCSFTATFAIPNEGIEQMARKNGGACANPKQIRTDVDCRAARPKFDNGAWAAFDLPCFAYLAMIEAVVPLMLFIMATILMFQLQSFDRLFLVFAVAPLALIGVVMALLPNGAPLGFVAILVVLALTGILIRNSVILIVQIEDLQNGPHGTVVDATEHRMRPIMLTAAAASLALIPIARDFSGGPWPMR